MYVLPGVPYFSYEEWLIKKYQPRVVRVWLPASHLSEVSVAKDDQGAEP